MVAPRKTKSLNRINGVKRLRNQEGGNNGNGEGSLEPTPARRRLRRVGELAREVSAGNDERNGLKTATDAPRDGRRAATNAPRDGRRAATDAPRDGRRAASDARDAAVLPPGEVGREEQLEDDIDDDPFFEEDVTAADLMADCLEIDNDRADLEGVEEGGCQVETSEDDDLQVPLEGDHEEREDTEDLQTVSIRRAFSNPDRPKSVQARKSNNSAPPTAVQGRPKQPVIRRRLADANTVIQVNYSDSRRCYYWCYIISWDLIFVHVICTCRSSTSQAWGFLTIMIWPRCKPYYSPGPLQLVGESPRGILSRHPMREVTNHPLRTVAVLPTTVLLHQTMVLLQPLQRQKNCLRRRKHGL